MNISYTFRKSAIEKAQHWELTENGLSFKQEGKGDAFIPYQHLSSIRILYKPFRFRPNNYSCVITVGTSNAEIFSTSYESIAKFSDLDTTYTPFVKELVQKTSNTNPLCKINAGQSVFTYTWHMALTVLVIVMLLILFSFIPIAGGAAFVIKMLLIGFYIVHIFKSFRVNVPRSIRDGHIPQKVLPTI